MRHAPIANALFTENRQRLRALLKPNSLAVVHASNLLATSADGVGPYFPQEDLFWLTGIEQEESILILAPDAYDEKRRCILFLREPNPHLHLWEGEKLTKERAQAISGIDEIRWLSDFPVLFRTSMCEAENVYLNSNEYPHAVISTASRDAQFIKSVREQFPLHTYQRLAPLITNLRAVKSDAEIALMKKACQITRDGFNDVLKMVKPGVIEYEVEATYAHAFIRQGGRMAYNPIIASGINNCVLHYNNNDQICRSGDLLLLDVASSYANYNADLTRTIPVNGRFSKRQRAVYDAVLRIVRTMTTAAVPGLLLRDWQKQCEALANEELLQLGLLTARDIKKQTPQKSACKKYFMHGCGHHIGLAVHDVGHLSLPIEKGCILTIEPGIYIPEEGFGVRIENDIVVNDQSGAIDLMADTPVEAEEIEQLMNGKKKSPSVKNRKGK